MAANVLSIPALQELKDALARFGGEARDALQAADLELQHARDWLTERVQHWRNEVRRWQQVLAEAKAALARCKASGMRDPKTGAYREPPCTAQWEAVRAAEAGLRAAEAELRTAQHWQRAVEQAGADYEREARRLRALLEHDGPRARALLENKITTLHSYVLLHAPAAATAPPTPSSTAGVQAAAASFAAAASLAAAAPALVGVALRALRQVDAAARQAMGAAGEDLTARLLREEFAWQELPFDQPHHGFDRLFRAPGLPLIVVESKVNRSGRFHPGRTAHGEQGSPEWLAHHADRMADPASAEWSAQNEGIAALVNDLGADNVPVVSVVINSDTGLANVYQRGAGGEWQLLQADLPAAEEATNE